MTSVALTTAVSGLNAAALQARTSAYNIANANTAKFNPLKVKNINEVANGRGAGVRATVVEVQGPNDLAANVVEFNQARVTYSANATVIRTIDEIAGTTVDLLA